MKRFDNIQTSFGVLWNSMELGQHVIVFRFEVLCNSIDHFRVMKFYGIQ